MTGATWEHFPHEADVGLRGRGPTLAAAFEQVAVAMTAVVTDPAGVRTASAVALECEAQDPELLLIEWLNALVYEMATRRMLFGRYVVSIDDGRLNATAWGEPVDVARHQPAAEVKGATYTALRVVQDTGGWWTAECVVDV